MFNSNNTRNKIEALRGMDEFKLFSHELERLAESRTRMHLEHVPVPSLLLQAEKGSGVTACARLLTEYLDTLNLLTLKGERTMFEFRYFNDESSYHALRTRIESAAGFYGEFNGVIVLDLRSADLAAAQLDNLLNYARHNQNHIVFMFVLPTTLSPKEEKDAIGCFSSMLVKHIRIESLKDDELVSGMEKMLADRGFQVKEGTKEPLKNMLADVRSSKLFEGYNTMQTIAQQLMFLKLSSINLSQDIEPADIESFRSTEIYKTLAQSAQRRSIGF